MVVIEPKMGNILITQERDVNKRVFSNSDPKKDLAYGIVDAVTKDYVDANGQKSTLKVGDRIIYNPRTLTAIEVNNKLKGMMHERNVIAIANIISDEA